MSDAAAADLGVCSLSLEIMVEPVTLGCGHNFERSQLNEWMTQKTRALRGRQASKGIHECPKCRAPFTKMPAVNLELKQMIERFIMPVQASTASAVFATPEEAAPAATPLSQPEVLQPAASRSSGSRKRPLALEAPTRPPPPMPEPPAKRPRNKNTAQARAIQQPSSSSQASGSISGTEQSMVTPPDPDLLRLILDLINEMATRRDPDTVDILTCQIMSALEEFQPPLTPNQRANLNAQATSGHTALYRATNLACKYKSESRFLEIVKRLIELGADLDLRSKANNYTALGCAIWLGNEDVAKMLIMAGAQRQFGRLGIPDSPLSKSGDMDYLTLARHTTVNRETLALAMEIWTSTDVVHGELPREVVISVPKHKSYLQVNPQTKRIWQQPADPTVFTLERIGDDDCVLGAHGPAHARGPWFIRAALHNGATQLALTATRMEDAAVLRMAPAQQPRMATPHLWEFSGQPLTGIMPKFLRANHYPKDKVNVTLGTDAKRKRSGWEWFELREPTAEEKQASAALLREW